MFARIDVDLYLKGLQVSPKGPKHISLVLKMPAEINTPLKIINMEHNHGGLEDHFPF